MNDDEYALPALLVALGGTPDLLKETEPLQEAPVDVAAHLAQRLWKNDALRTGRFNPSQFRHLCENIIRWELLKLEEKK